MPAAFRILVELLAPSVFGGTIALVWTIAGHFSWKNLLSFPFGVLMFSFFAVFACGLQSLCFAGILECAYILGLKRTSKRFVVLSTCLGFASGAVIPLAGGHTVADADGVMFSVVGTLTGLFVGLLLRHIEHRFVQSPNQSLEPTPHTGR